MRLGRKERGRHSGSFIPMMLLHRLRGTGSFGREELARRADDFAHGRFSLLLRGMSRHRIVTVHPRCSRHLRASRQGSTESCGGGPGFPRTTRVGWSKFGSKDTGNTRRVALVFVPEHPLVSASSHNVFRMRRQGGHQDREGASTRCGGCVWTSGLLKISLEQTFLKVHGSHSCQQQCRNLMGSQGIATGTSFRRLVAKTLARQFSKQVEATCAPFQFALSTRVGTDCVGHAIRALIDADPTATVLSMDGLVRMTTY